MPVYLPARSLLDDILVDLACGDILLAHECDIEVAFVIAKVKVDFTAISRGQRLTSPCL